MRLNRIGKLLLFAPLGLVSLLQGCDKDDFTEPAPVALTLNTASRTALQGRISVNSADLNLGQIEIAGQREGSNVLLTRDFPGNGNAFLLIGNDPAQPLRFDIPQGTYDRLSFNLLPVSQTYQLIVSGDDDDDDDDGDDDDENGIVDLNHFFANAKPAILLRATYVNGSVSREIILAVDNQLKLTGTARQNSSAMVTLRRSGNHTAEMKFDPGYWFGLVTTAQIESAAFQPYMGKDAVLIHKDYNKTLYALITARINESTQLSVSQ